MISFPGGSNGKVSACIAGDPGLIPGLGRSIGKENSYPPQYSYLEDPMNRGAWQATRPWDCRVRHNWATKHARTYTMLWSFLLIGDCEREKAGEGGTYFSISGMWIFTFTFSASGFVFLTLLKTQNLWDINYYKSGCLNSHRTLTVIQTTPWLFSF